MRVSLLLALLAGCNALIGLDEPTVRDGGLDARALDAGHAPPAKDAAVAPFDAAPPEGCVPKACAGDTCGTVGDGCGGLVQCAPCPPLQTCGGGGPNRCGSGSCTPKTCVGLGLRCGQAGDGCGNVIDCGTCTGPQQQCMGGHCCAPEPCGSRCGPQGDGCGSVIQCGPCEAGCTPLGCAQQAVMCGPAGDGCGALLDCGPCPGPMWCGNPASPGTCDPQCAPVMCNPP
jgi:hypothetical protein